MCGAGTTLVAALSLGRRFIGIDLNPWAIETCWHRVREIIEEKKDVPTRARSGRRARVVVKTVAKLGSGFVIPGRGRYGIDWDCGDSFLILGDSLDVLRDIPEGVVDLIYNDPPFNSGKNYKTGKSFFDWIGKQRAKRPWPELGQESSRPP